MNNDGLGKIRELEAKTSDYKEASSRFRSEKRELWNNIIILSSAILAFSVTMVSGVHIEISWLLKMGWGLFLINILCGLFLLKKESEFQQEQSLANLAQKFDEVDIETPPKTQGDKDKFVGLLYLHSLRGTPPKELPFSPYAKDIFERVKGELQSWRMIKNPQKFYSYSHMAMINKTSYFFYGSFVLAIIFLISAVIF